VRTASCVTLALVVVATVSGTAQTARRNVGAPETFSANATAVKSGSAAASATIQIHIERYTPDFDRTAVETALKTGGYPAFLTALRKAPDVGYVQHGDAKTIIRWARQTDAPKGRRIVVVTEKPIFFLGGGSADAKPRAGYEVAVIEMNVDDVGLGTGTMAAAARVKPGGEAGVQIDDYAETPIKLATVRRMQQ
jgi:hypothetical protein